MNESGVAFIGGGHMARALIAGLIRQGYPAERVAVGEPLLAARTALAQDFGIRAFAENRAALERASLIVLAVKPQDLGSVLVPLAPDLQRARPLVISIAAGVPLSSLRAWCGEGIPIVRAMPNRPALVGAGATGLCGGTSLDDGMRQRAQAIMQAAGIVVWIDDEALMDAVTAVSGSGPAYFFLLAEALADAAVAQGLAPDVARRLAAATLTGAGRMAEGDRTDLVSLRAQVTSRGGTTESAVRSLEAAGWRATLAAAVDAAVVRGRELGGSVASQNPASGAPGGAASAPTNS